ncbi:alkaline phosphatase D family protein [Hymenobacter arizonensis]|uniref:Alkaline phosphatase D n=1 Tax=Hymenobacter arizonensis TaxID=1227077 RepID=A0A1I5TQW2_HYMAR|nr:alkaline phosphatase D family protein [Hymenobacter arizonensis]SFP85464.1 alkaline phosphatase D [Hymenobacter arizonensis]
MKKSLLLALLSWLWLWGPAAQAQAQKELTLAFGSCNRVDLPQPLWPVIARDQPDVWLWLGDNVYGDTDDMAVLRRQYDTQFNLPGYAQFRAQIPTIIGTWDDHDYGRNDGNKTYPFKRQSQQAALDFLQEPAASARRQQEGLYTAYEYAVGKKTVKVLLLDGRYFQDTLSRDAQQRYQPNATGDVLGEEQWQWLEQHLQGSTADAHIIAGGIQFLPQEHAFEKWANFPAARQRLLALLARTQAKGVVLLSGDRHIGEISRLRVPGVAYPVYEITSSGLTHPATHNTGEPNALRVGPLVNQMHYALLRFRQRGGHLVVTAAIKGAAGQELVVENIGPK